LGTIGHRGCTAELEAGGRKTALSDSELLAAISTGIVGNLREHYGRGPMKAKTYALDDIVVVVLRGSGFTPLERTIMDSGQPDRVIAMRRDFQRDMADRYKQTIEELSDEAPAVQQPGERIMLHEVAELALVPLALLDVLQLSDAVQRLTRRAADQRGVHQDPHRVTFCMEQALLNLEVVYLAGAEAGHCRQIDRRVLWVQELTDVRHLKLFRRVARQLSERAIDPQKPTFGSRVDAHQRDSDRGILECDVEICLDARRRAHRVRDRAVLMLDG
jgi:uncharacterized protein YbcI